MLTKNILLFGQTGSGKSTLANVLLNKNGNFEEVFESSDSISSITKEVQVEEFTEKETTYRIIDTVGIYDTSLNHQQVAEKLAEALKKSNEYEGITQIFFLIGGKFSKDEIQTYNLLKLIDQDIDKHITIIRTNYVDFEDEEDCQEDISNLLKLNSQIAEIINSCNKFIHIDNPSIDFSLDTEMYRNLVKMGKETREVSRQKLLNHLATCQANLKLDNLDNISEKITKYLIDTDEKNKKETEEEIRKFREELEEEKNKWQN